MRFQCIHCQGILAVDDFQPGEAVACGHCGSVVAVPESRMAPGAMVGDFVIRSLLGEGGMGSVYLAHQVSLDRTAAVKILHDRYSADAAYIEDFIREARSAAALNHPNIVQAYAVGDDEGLFYFAMEYVEGSTLQQVLLHGGRLVADRALSIAIEIAEALDFAWRKQGLVHRDIKPDNIILTPGGHAKLADLGLARKINDSSQKSSQALYGTPQYISPEQLLGAMGDNRSDIYSLGATLYHALTGRFPYEGDSPTDIAQKHLVTSLEPMRSLLPDIPEDVAAVVEAALAKRPAHRYENTAEFLDDLKRVRAGKPPRRRPAPDAQRPIDLEAGDADLLVSAAFEEEGGGEPSDTALGSKKLAIVQKDLPESSAENSAADSPSASGSRPVLPPSEIPPVLDRGSKAKRLAIVAVAALLVLGAGAFLAYRYLGSGEEVAVPEGGPESAVSALPGKDAAAELEAVRKQIAAGRGEREIVRKLAALAPRCAADAGLSERFFDLAAPYVEKDLQGLRETPRGAELEDWKARQEKWREEEKLAREEAEKRRRAEEVQRKKEEEERQKAEQKAAYLKEIRAKQQKLRTEAVTLCRTHDYSGAALLFAGMLSSRDPEVRKWAERKQACIRNAGALYGLISNSGKLLAGTVLPVSGDKKHEWKVVDIGYATLELQARFIHYEHGEKREEMKERKLSLENLAAPQMYLLAKARWTRAPAPEKPLPLLFGCYLLARAEYLTEAGKQLRKAGAEGEVFLEELEPLAPLARQWEFQRYLERLRAYAASGKMSRSRVKKLVMGLKARFPEEYEKNLEAIRALVGGSRRK